MESKFQQLHAAEEQCNTMKTMLDGYVDAGVIDSNGNLLVNARTA